MKQRFIFLLAFVLLIILLIGLNAASYVQQVELPDSEAGPNRSTFNSGSTGTRAYHDLLVESGVKVRRWQQPISREFEIFDVSKIATFIILGDLRRPMAQEEIEFLLNWVSAGGQLVMIDRDPATGLLVTSAAWKLAVDEGKNALSQSEKDVLIRNVDPSDQIQMTTRTPATIPIQPTVFNSRLIAVQPSKFASSITISRVIDSYASDGPETGPAVLQDGDLEIFSAGQYTPKSDPPPPPPVNRDTDADANDGDDGERVVEEGHGSGSAVQGEIAVKDSAEDNGELEDEFELWDLAPVIHLSNDDKNILADFPLGAGRIVLLTDPYIVSNGGIDLVDNAQLAINIAGSRSGPVAFDEYHQGFGNDKNHLLAYFAGTPVIAILLQLAGFIGIVLFSRGRRFGRALPEVEPDRLSKLEYVAAMAQLQSRTKAFDLAVENIYTEFRRRVSRSFGVDNFTVSKETLTTLLSERLAENEAAVYSLLEKCEDIMHGEPTSKKEVVRLIKRLREIEERLGLERHKVRNL